MCVNVYLCLYALKRNRVNKGCCQWVYLCYNGVCTSAGKYLWRVGEEKKSVLLLAFRATARRIPGMQVLP